MFLTLYKILNIILSPLLLLFILFRCCVGKEDKKRIRERFAFSLIERPKGKLCWVHVASVGEMLSILHILKFLEISLNYRVLLTSGTILAAKIAKNKVPSSVIHQYIPIENYFIIKRFLKYWKPDAAIFVESEFWPCLISETAKYCKIISLNTRLSDASYRKWRLFNKFCREVLGSFFMFIPQSIPDKVKLENLGIKKIKYFGNLKYSTGNLPYNENTVTKFTNKAIGRKIILFASTHLGEEEIAIDVYKQIQNKDKSVLIIIAPRHPIRAPKIELLLKKDNYEVAMKSKNESISNNTQFYIVDTIGDLGTFYKLSPITVMGGSFVNIGGHNPIEPARLKSAVIMGPYMHNFKGICKDFKNANAAIFVNDANECAKAIKALWHNRQTHKKYINNALALIQTTEKILPQTLECIKEILQ